MQSQTAVVLGATGLIGGYVLQYLLADPAYDKVKALTSMYLVNPNSIPKMAAFTGIS